MKIMTGGVAKAEVADALKKLVGPDDEVIIGTDMDAAMKLRSGAIDYYFGTCHTGAGASLGVLLGLLGGAKTHTFGRTVPPREVIAKEVASGKVAFGFAMDQIQDVVPVLWSEIASSRA
ncbi:DUF2620 family protein [Enemella sp. A6]|uniref:DUF2620 family protein n=1 Tax=Enemella sp. A6 TaxID=3440152 RepID=UPI003EB8F79C